MAIAAVSSAQASTVYNSTITNPVIYGSGNNYSPQNFAVTTEGNLEIALRSHVRNQPAGMSTGNTYFLPTGLPGFSFDYSVNAGTGSLTGLLQSLTITNLGNPALNYTFNPSAVPDNTPSGNGYQNSEAGVFFNGLFPGSNIGYDVNANNAFSVVLRVGSASVSNIIQIGSGVAVPEPTTWAMMILGLGGVGAAMRRKRRSPAFATA